MVDRDYACASWRGGGQGTGKIAWEMAEEVNMIITEQKLKKEDSKATPPEVPSSKIGRAHV